MQDNSLPFHHMTNERLPSVLSRELPARNSMPNELIPKSMHPGLGRQSYYEHQIRNNTRGASFSKAVAQSGYANHANVISLTRTLPTSDSQILRCHNQGKWNYFKK